DFIRACRILSLFMSRRGSVTPEWPHSALCGRRFRGIDASTQTGSTLARHDQAASALRSPEVADRLSPYCCSTSLRTNAGRHVGRTLGRWTYPRPQLASSAATGHATYWRDARPLPRSLEIPSQVHLWGRRVSTSSAPAGARY